MTRAGTPTFAEDKSAQEVVSGGPRAHSLPCGVIGVLKTTEQHVSLAAVGRLWLVLVVHDPGA